MGTNRDWRPFLYGGVASITAECGTFPIDTTKTRLQVQGQIIDVKLKDLRYRGMTHALFRIFREEGVIALYAGIAPAVLRQATYGTIKIGTYHSMKRLFVSDPKDETLPVNVFCGVVAGVISSCIANPTDVLKIRMQARLGHEHNRNMLLSFCDIYKLEGAAGLWRGVGPTAQRAAIVAGVLLPTYDLCKRGFLNSGKFDDNEITHFMSSFLAGFAGAVASSPVDVVKTRLMNQRKLKASVIGNGAVQQAIYKSSLDCLIQTVRTEGVMALYKGFIPNWVRLGPWNIIFFMTYEQLKNLGSKSDKCSPE